HPHPADLREIVRELHNQGFQVAIHAVESEAVSAAAEAIKLVDTQIETKPALQHRHRIEHCAELPPEVFAQVVASGAVVVTQPGFVYSSGHRYIAEVSAGNHPWLYRIGALRNSGVVLGFGSDAPVIDPNPMLGIYSAVNRKSKDGAIVAPDEAIGVQDALKAYTVGSAFVGHLETHLGVIRPGHFADLILFDRDLTTHGPAELTETRVTHTIIGGSLVWNTEGN
ncbi:MAG: amidohydrolase family protein, partial [Chloroflexi bacterium]|nr:amidohydrolase family protein [Chloroflexota bacterium]